MSKIRRQMWVIQCDLCGEMPGDDPYIMKQIRVGDYDEEKDICMDCWEKIRWLVAAEDKPAK